MEIKKIAIAGTYESSDTFVRVEPSDKIEIDLQSSVIEQYGDLIKKSVNEVLESLEVTNAKIIIVDKGALDCTLRARVETAIFRAAEVEEVPWGRKI